LTDQHVSEAVGCHPGTVGRLRKRYTEDGLAAITRSKANRVYERKLDGREEANLSALACSDPPEEARHLFSKVEFHFTPTHGS